MAQEAQPNASLVFSPYFDVFCDLSLHVQTHGNKQSTYFMWGEKKIGNGNVMRFDKTLLVFIVSTVLSWSAGHDYCGLLDGWWASRMFFRFIYLLFLLIDCVFLVKVMSKVQASTEVHLSLLNTKRKTRSLNFDVLLIFRPLHMMCIF